MKLGMNSRIIKADRTFGGLPWMEIPPPLWIPVPQSDHLFIVKGWAFFPQAGFLLLQLALVASHLFSEQGKSVFSVDPH